MLMDVGHVEYFLQQKLLRFPFFDPDRHLGMVWSCEGKVVCKTRSGPKCVVSSPTKPWFVAGISYEWGKWLQQWNYGWYCGNFQEWPWNQVQTSSCQIHMALFIQNQSWLLCLFSHDQCCLNIEHLCWIYCLANYGVSSNMSTSNMWEHGVSSNQPWFHDCFSELLHLPLWFFNISMDSGPFIDELWRLIYHDLPIKHGDSL